MKPIRPMLAEPGGTNDLGRAGWIYEPKFDGIRAIISKNGNVEMRSRRGLRIERRYPDLVPALEQALPDKCVVDGEVIALDEQGRVSFQQLQMREHVSSAFQIELRASQYPALVVLFDMLVHDGKSITHLPLAERVRLLRKAIMPNSSVFLSPSSENGKQTYRMAQRFGLEGIVAKRASSPYTQVRSRDWLKIKFVNTLDCIIVGYRRGEGRRKGVFGALCLAAYRNGTLVYLGRVGTGWDDAFVQELALRLRPMATDRIPVANPPENWKRLGITWVKPKLVCEVEYREVTHDRQLRAPSFKRLREDKEPRECVLPLRTF